MAERFRKKVFCEVQFLKLLSQKINEENQSFSSASYQEIKVWHSIKNFLLNSSIELNLDCSESEREQLYKEVEGKLRKAVKKGSKCPLFEDLIYKSINDQKRVQVICGHNPLPNSNVSLKSDAIYLTLIDKALCEKLSRETGSIFISPDNINLFTPLINDNGLSINKDESGVWSSILNYCSRISCNQVTIVDNYLLSDKESIIEKNLKQILNSLLPKESEKIFPVRIFTTLVKDSTGSVPVDFFERWEFVKKSIIGLKRHYPIILSIVKCTDKPFHDRTIFTNNIWISSGAGFNLFNENDKARHSTVINIVSPFLNDTIQWAFNAYGNLIKETQRQYSSRGKYEELKTNSSLNLKTGIDYIREEVIEGES